MIEIAKATIEDLPKISELAKEVWPVAFNDILSPEQIQYMLEMMYSNASLKQQFENGHHYLLARYENKYSGYISYENNLNLSRTTKIHKLYTLPSFKRTGIGRTLVEEVIKLASKADDKKLILNVNKQNIAIAFYEKIGFKIVAEETIPIGNGFFMDDFIMAKDL